MTIFVVVTPERPHNFLMRIAIFFVISILVIGVRFDCWAFSVNPSPLGWAHALPQNESARTKKSVALTFEYSVGNYWATPLVLRDRQTSRDYVFIQDFEQKSEIIYAHAPLSPDIEFQLGLMAADRSGGFLDRSIDAFHSSLHMERFQRENFSFDQGILLLGAASSNSKGIQSGLSNLTLDLKFQLFDPGEKFDDFGLLIQLREKEPLAGAETLLSSGARDYSGIVVLSAPISTAWKIKMMAGHSWLGTSVLLSDCTRFAEVTAASITPEVSFSERWGLSFNWYSSSPFLDRERFQARGVDGHILTADERWRTSWNSLTEWTSYQTLTLRYRTSKLDGSLFITEDWDITDRDQAGDSLSVNGSPDFSLGASLSLSF